MEDTGFQNALADYQRIIKANGFEKVYEELWHSTHGHDEILFIYAHRDGLLLCFTTYRGVDVNGGHVYYNLPYPAQNVWKYTSSGGVRNNVWAGDHNCRDNLIRNMNRLRNNGGFVSPWKARPFLWLLNYDEGKFDSGDDYKALTERRIGCLPD